MLRCRVTAVAIVQHPSGRGYLVSGSADRSLKLWGLGSGKCLRSMTRRPAEVTSITSTG